MVIKIIASILLSLSLAACFGQKPLQPHPPTHTHWTKDGVSAEGVKAAMRQCGYIDIHGYGGDKVSTMNDQANMVNCMYRNGFKHNQNLNLCKLESYKDLPACQSNPQPQKEIP